jgi:hypothetical protein
MARSPRILRHLPAPKAMQKARLAVHHRSACSGVKALRNTSAAKLCWRFGPLTPSARSANLIAGDGTKNGFPAPNKEPPTNQNHHLTGKAPYRFESVFLQQRVCEPLLPQPRSPSVTLSVQSRARRNRRRSTWLTPPRRGQATRRRVLSASGLTDSFGHAQLDGVAPLISNLISTKLGCKCHWAVPDYLLRSARHIASETALPRLKCSWKLRCCLI